MLKYIDYAFELTSEHVLLFYMEVLVVFEILLCSEQLFIVTDAKNVNPAYKRLYTYIFGSKMQRDKCESKLLSRRTIMGNAINH